MERGGRGGWSAGLLSGVYEDSGDERQWIRAIEEGATVKEEGSEGGWVGKVRNPHRRIRVAAGNVVGNAEKSGATMEWAEMDDHRGR